MLSSQNSGKYFTKTWNRERGNVMLDSSRSSTADKDYYEVTEDNWEEGSFQAVQDTLGNLETTPIDSLTPAKRFDQRDKPEVGW